MRDSKLPALKIPDNNTERKAVINLLGVMKDDNKTWEEHIRKVRTKLAQNIDLIYRTKESILHTFILI